MFHRQVDSIFDFLSRKLEGRVETKWGQERCMKTLSKIVCLAVIVTRVRSPGAGDDRPNDSHRAAATRRALDAQHIMEL
jgi:hypothetical protein